MARKLKVYRTSIGFFELAIAAPSMKAAAEAWGATPDIFSRGFAEQTEDEKIVEAAMASPGVVLRRPVGSHGAFGEKAALPKDETPVKKPAPRAANSNTKREADGRAAEKAKRDEAAAREREEKRRAEEKRLADEKRRKDAEAERERKRREQLIARADAALERAKARHEDAVKTLSKRRKELDADEAREAETWDAEQRAHREAVSKAKS